MKSKEETRAKFQKIRESLSPSRRREARQNATDTLYGKLSGKGLVLSFASKSEEIDLWPLNKRLADENRLVLPRLTSDTEITPFIVDNIDELVICYDNGTPEGRMFNDTSQESFTASGCGVIPEGTYAPFTLGPETLVLPIIGARDVDEIAAFGQTTNILGNDLTWNIGSTINGATVGTQAYVSLSCTEVASGTWSWNGRSGTILLD